MKHDNLSDDMERVEEYLQELQELPTKPIEINAGKLVDERSWTNVEPKNLPELTDRKDAVIAIADHLDADHLDKFKLGETCNIGYEVFARFGELRTKVQIKATGDLEFTASTGTFKLHEVEDDE